jgi:hypothetical protein
MMAADALQLQDKTTCRQACYRDEIGLFWPTWAMKYGQRWMALSAW